MPFLQENFFVAFSVVTHEPVAKYVSHSNVNEDVEPFLETRVPTPPSRMMSITNALSDGIESVTMHATTSLRPLKTIITLKYFPGVVCCLCFFSCSIDYELSNWLAIF